MNKQVQRDFEIETSDRAPLGRVRAELEKQVAQHLAEFNKRGPRWRARMEEPRRCSSFDLYSRGAVCWRVRVTFISIAAGISLPG